MKVTDLGKGARTYRVSMAKGDEMMSGLTDFAEKYHIKNGHFTALGAINKGLFGWSDVERGLGQKKIELNQEAEIVSLDGEHLGGRPGPVDRAWTRHRGAVGRLRPGRPLVGSTREHHRGSVRNRGGGSARAAEVGHFAFCNPSGSGR